MGETLRCPQVGQASGRAAGWWHPYIWQLIVSEWLSLKQRGEHPKPSPGKYEYMPLPRESTRSLQGDTAYSNLRSVEERM